MNLEVKPLSPQEAYSLLQSIGGELDDYLATRLVHPGESVSPEGPKSQYLALQLHDGTVLTGIPIKSGFNPFNQEDWSQEKICVVALFGSRENFLDRTDPSKPIPPPPDPYAPVQPYGASFPQHVVELSKQLPERLNIAPEALDGTFWTLDVVDKALSKMDLFTVQQPEIFGPLMAYVGEIIRVATEGEWEMEYEKDYYGIEEEGWKYEDDPYGHEMGIYTPKPLWIPYIVSNGRRVDDEIFSEILISFDENGGHWTAVLVRGRIWHTFTPDEKIRSNAVIGYVEE